MDHTINRNIVLSMELELFKEAQTNKNTSKKFLNLSCGGRILKGFINVDKEHLASGVLNYDIFQLPFEAESVHTIFCSHTLEHLPLKHAKFAIREWARVLERSDPLGGIFLGIPNLDRLLVSLLDPSIDVKTREWFMYCLYGFQNNPTNTDGNILDYPLDFGQFHNCGFNKKTITTELESNGFTIQEIFEYDSGGTPSLWIRAYIL